MIDARSILRYWLLKASNALSFRCAGRLNSILVFSQSIAPGRLMGFFRDGLRGWTRTGPHARSSCPGPAEDKVREVSDPGRAQPPTNTLYAYKRAGNSLEESLEISHPFTLQPISPFTLRYWCPPLTRPCAAMFLAGSTATPAFPD